MKLLGTWRWTKWPKADCEVSQAIGFVTLGQDPWVCRHDVTSVKFLLLDLVTTLQTFVFVTYGVTTRTSLFVTDKCFQTNLFITCKAQIIRLALKTWQ
jgi:hypothetical protein